MAAWAVIGKAVEVPSVGEGVQSGRKPEAVEARQ
jgi:hypothetical protein